MRERAAGAVPGAGEGGGGAGESDAGGGVSVDGDGAELGAGVVFEVFGQGGGDVAGGGFDG